MLGRAFVETGPHLTALSSTGPDASYAESTRDATQSYFALCEQFRRSKKCGRTDKRSSHCLASNQTCCSPVDACTANASLRAPCSAVEGVDLNSHAGKVLFLTVTSSASDPALGHARVLAREAGNSLLIVEVDADEFAPAEPSSPLAASAGLTGANDVATEVRRISPEQVAELAAGDDIELILVGSHGRNSLRHLLQLVPASAQGSSSGLGQESIKPAKRPGGERLHARLTPRETEVLVYLAQGLSVKECARVMRRSPSTIDNHKTRLMRKLGMHRVVDLARFAVREGLISK